MWKGYTDISDLLLANKADVNARDRDGNSPLHFAAFNDHKDIADLLLAKGAAVNAKTDKGVTPLHWAAMKGHKDVVELLLANTADVNAQTEQTVVPLPPCGMRKWAIASRSTAAGRLCTWRRFMATWTLRNYCASTAGTNKFLGLPKGDCMLSGVTVVIAL